ncbi:MAG: hypothetical protein EPO27_16215 [Betaproteobacteria bacterium]|nr:MAG: hypothetical protein EPO27_16215 [Betaproteobacteria bacterium]
MAILQPGYLPWLGFFDQMASVDVFVYYDDVQFDKHGWRNRNRIKVPGGFAWLTVPVLHKGQDKPRVNEIRIDNSRDWRRKHLGTLRQHYAHAEHAPPYLRDLERLFETGWTLLAELDIALIDLMRGWLGIATKTVRSSALGIGGGQSGRLLNICRHFGAGSYLSGPAAREYLDVPMFEADGIRVQWQEYRHPVYPQQHGAFIPYLSAIDLILNAGKESPVLFRQRQDSGEKQ